MNNELIFRKELANPPDFTDVASYQYQTIYPINGLSDFNQYKSVRFNLLQQNLLLHLRNGYLEISGQILKVKDSAKFTDEDKISLCHNAACFMFSEASLAISGQIVENVSFLGHASTMLHSALFSERADGLSYSWVPDYDKADTTSKGFVTRQNWFIKEPMQADDKGKFILKLPLSLIFGFCERFQVFTGYGLEICLIRSPDYECLLKANDADEGKLKISSICLNIPIVKPSDEIKMELLTEVRNKRNYEWSFRKRSALMQSVPNGLTEHQLSICNTSFEERPLFVLIGFQDSKTSDEKFNHAVFVPEDLQSLTVKQNSVQYPRVIREANFTRNDLGPWYESFVNFRAQYLQISGQYNPTSEVTPGMFKKLNAVFIVDCSKSESVVARSVQTEVQMKFRTPTPKRLRVYILYISERTVNLTSTGDSISLQ